MNVYLFHIELPLVLLLLPLAVLPWLSHNDEAVIVWDAFIPDDPLSNAIEHILKGLASIAIASLIVVLSLPYIPEKTIQVTGKGAEFVILLDRSRSMDEPFAVKDRAQLVNHDPANSKRRIATQYLQQFIEKRPDDRFGFIFFSKKSIPLLPMTYNKEVVLATVQASALGKGISDTDIGQALVQAANLYKDQPYRGSRNILLVSDGGKVLNDDEKKAIERIYDEQNINLYWIYLRSVHGMTLDEQQGESVLLKDRPERKLHQFFKQTRLPYHVFEADTHDNFLEALDEISHQQFQQIRVNQTIPKKTIVSIFLFTALICLFPIVLIKMHSLWGLFQQTNKA